jgi:hypothetical protein
LFGVGAGWASASGSSVRLRLASASFFASAAGGLRRRRGLPRGGLRRWLVCCERAPPREL